MVILEEEIQPVREFLIRIEGLVDTYVKGEGVKRIYAPTQLFDETQGLCEEGTIIKAPLSLEDHWPDLVGKKVIFSFLEAHSTLKGNTPVTNGCLLVSPQYIIEVEGRMYGEYLFCDRIEKDVNGIIVPDTKLSAYDSTRRGEVNMYPYHLDKGMIKTPNDHFEVGVIVYWGKSSYINQHWQGRDGFLVKRRSIKAFGPDVINFKSKNI